MLIPNTTTHYLNEDRDHSSFTYSEIGGCIHSFEPYTRRQGRFISSSFCVVFRIKQCNQYEFTIRIQLVRIYELKYN